MFAAAPSSCATATTPSTSRPLSSAWSRPVSLAGCTATAPVQIGFPESSPATATGPGAIVCAGATGGLAVASLAQTGAPIARPLGTNLIPPFATTTTGDGRIVIAGSTPNGGGRGAAITELAPGAAPAPASPLHGPAVPLALNRAYLGDTAAASLVADRQAPALTDAIVLRVQRHNERSFERPLAISHRRGIVTALNVALDYRGDTLVTWEQGGWIWGRVWRADSGEIWPPQRIGSSAPHPQLEAVISDDNRAIVVWSSTKKGRTHTWIATSAPLVRFSSRPKLVESFADAPGFALPAGSLALVRSSTEGVVLFWTGKETSNHAARVAAVGLSGLGPTTTLSDPASDAILAAAATGPHADEIAAWAANRNALVVSRGTIVRGQARFASPEPIGPVTGAAAVGIDPASDSAIAGWQDGAAIEWSRRAPYS